MGRLFLCSSLENGSGVFYTVRKAHSGPPVPDVNDVTHLRVFLLALEVEIKASHFKALEAGARTRTRARLVLEILKVHLTVNRFI